MSLEHLKYDHRGVSADKKVGIEGFLGEEVGDFVFTISDILCSNICLLSNISKVSRIDFFSIINFLRVLLHDHSILLVFIFFPTQIPQKHKCVTYHSNQRLKWYFFVWVIRSSLS